ncbi:MAG: MFS transporter [Planctomycetota bacterium]|jgi:MFS family permease
MSSISEKLKLPHRAVVLAASATAVSLLGDQAFYAILQAHGEDLGLYAFQIGVLLSANRWIRLLTNHLAERLIHRFLPTLLFVAALVLGAAATAAYGVWSFFSALLAARIVWGLCWSVIRQVGIMTCVDTAPRERAARTMGFYSALSRVGSVAGLMVGAYLFDLLDFRLCFLILGCAMLLAVVPGAAARRRLDGGVSEFRRPRTTAGPNRTGGLLICGFVVGCVGPGVIFSTLGYVLRNRLGESLTVGRATIGIATVTAIVLSVRHVIALTGAPLLGHLADRAGHKKSTLMFFVLTTCILAAAAMVPWVWLLIVLVILIFVCTTSLHVVLAAEAGGLGSRSYAWYATAADLGAAAGPLLAWTVFHFIAVPSLSFAIGAAFYVIGSLKTRWRSRNAQAVPE